MIMADVLKITLLIIGILMVFISYWLAGEALFPDWVERARQQYQSHATKITLLGAVILAPSIGLGILIGSVPNPAVKLIGLVVGSLPVLIGMLGSAGLSRRIGLGLPSALDEQDPWRRALRGAIVLALTFLLPVIGWFFVLPLTIASGVGAALVAWRQNRKVLAPPIVAAKAVLG